MAFLLILNITRILLLVQKPLGLDDFLVDINAFNFIDEFRLRFEQIHYVLAVTVLISVNNSSVGVSFLHITLHLETVNEDLQALGRFLSEHLI